MVGAVSRQWYRMPVGAVLDVFGVDESIGLRSAKDKPKNRPIFLPKNTWRFYVYSVLRNGTYRPVPIDQLAEGDIVSLHKGDIVPATMRLLRANSVAVNEDYLSGTVAPSYKQTFASRSLLPSSQQKNMLFAGSELLNGSAKGVVVTLAQYKRQKVAKSYNNRRYAKLGIVTQTPNISKVVKKVEIIFFDDLQQPSEVIRLIQALYQAKGIRLVFFVNSSMEAQLKTILPTEMFNRSRHQGVLLRTNILDADKAVYVAAANAHNSPTMYVHRGNDHHLLSKAASVNMVVSVHAAQCAIRQADLIASNISVKRFSCILYNKK